jgi:hypothetical protein
MYFDRRAAHVTYCVIAVRRSRDEDQQLESNVDDRLCPAPDPTTAGALSPTNQGGQYSTTWLPPPGSADRLLGDLLRYAAAPRRR